MALDAAGGAGDRHDRVVHLQPQGLPVMLRLTSWLAPIFAACSLALAGGGKPPVEIKSIEMGWAATVAAERWTPAVVWISSENTPFTGVLRVEFDQDSTQK